MRPATRLHYRLAVGEKARDRVLKLPLIFDDKGHKQVFDLNRRCTPLPRLEACEEY